MRENVINLIDEAQAAQAVHGCAFKLDFGPGAGPSVVKTLERIMAGILLGEPKGKVTLEAIIAGGLRHMENEVSGNPAELNDVQQAELARVLRRIYGKGHPSKSNPTPSVKKSQKSKK